MEMAAADLRVCVNGEINSEEKVCIVYFSFADREQKTYFCFSSISITSIMMILPAFY